MRKCLRPISTSRASDTQLGISASHKSHQVALQSNWPALLGLTGQVKFKVFVLIFQVFKGLNPDSEEKNPSSKVLE